MYRGSNIMQRIILRFTGVGKTLLKLNKQDFAACVISGKIFFISSRFSSIMIRITEDMVVYSSPETREVCLANDFSRVVMFSSVFQSLLGRLSNSNLLTTADK